MSWTEYKALLRNVIARERRLIGCRGKETFLTFDQAKYVATHRRGRDGRRTRMAYRCNLCFQYHIGDVQTGRQYRLRMKERTHA